MTQPLPSWHGMTARAVADHWQVDPARGLSASEGDARREKHGQNVLREARRRSTLRMLLDQFTDVTVLVLMAAAVVAGMVGEPQDTIAIVAIIILNAGLGFSQEYRAEQAVRALQAMSAPLARVRRDSEVVTIPAHDLVPGDVVLLEAGMIVPADLRLTRVHHLRIDESALTGESQAVDKAVPPIGAPDTPLGDRLNMAWKGTVATYGRGEGLVVATGMATELGRVATLLDEAEQLLTPLQRRLKRFAAQLAVVVIVLCAAIFAIGLLRGEPPILMFLTALSLAVAAMPEALPAVVTVSLALGARRMVARHALIRRLPAVETLGSVTYICTDKTGTLTQNRMMVAELRDAGGTPLSTEGAHPGAEALVQSMVLNSDAVAGPEGVRGDPTEVALVEYAMNAAVDVPSLLTTHPRVAELPFSSERGRMSTLHTADQGPARLLVKGAPEQVLRLCTHARLDGDDVPIDLTAATRHAEEMAAAGLRVLAFGVRTFEQGDDIAATPADLSEEDESGFTCLGFAGLLDPPRAEAEQAVAECARAGIHVVMITGDHPSTADAIARALAIAAPDAPSAVTGTALAALDDAALHAQVETLRVYARVAPEQKIRIVRALQSRGESVAMTGDGVNDAPALRQADIGIAMGRGGTDVAREAADMVLTDDNFASIVAAIREGRRIYDNIRKFIRYVLTGNSAEIWLLFLAPLFGLPLPLQPIHILWINLVTDGLPGLALAVEPEDDGAMRRPPRPPDESVFAHGLWQHALWVGLLMGGVSLFTQWSAIGTGSTHWQSMVFTVLALSQLGHVLAVRSERTSLFTQGVWSNRPLALAVLGTAVLQLATLYVPFLNPIFKTEPLSLAELGVCLALSAVAFLAVEGEKVLLRRGFHYRSADART